MNCESVRKGLSLYLYGELSFEQEELFAQHLDDSHESRRELEREKRMHRALDAAEMEPPAELLEQCRLDLPRAVRNARRPLAGPAGWIRGLRSTFASPAALRSAWLRPVGAVALVAVGFFAARFTGVAPVSSGWGSAPAEPVATQVRYVEPSPAGGVRIVVDETRQRVLTGSLGDEQVRKLLLAAMRNPSDVGVRAESVDLLKSRPGSREVKDALLYTVENDPNDGVRLKALEGLRGYPGDAETRKALSRLLLHDRNPGIRSMAIDLLVDSDTDDVVDTLQKLMQREENNSIRLRGQNALRAMNASVESF